MKTLKWTWLCAACITVMGGCGFLKKERVESTAAPKAEADDGAVETAGTGVPADAAAEPSVKAGSKEPEKEPAGSATFTVKREGDGPSGYGVSPGAYAMDLKRAGIVTGTKNGLQLSFESADDWMSIFLPSIKKINIRHAVDDKGAHVELKHAPLPFSLSSDDYPSDPKDGRGRSMLIGPVVTNRVTLPGGNVTARLTHFKKFKITVTSLSVSGHALTMSCSFEGESVPDPSQPQPAYTLSGSLTVTGAELGLTHMD